MTIDNVIKKLCDVARELNEQEDNLHLWNKLNKCILNLQEMQPKETTFILLRQDFKEQPPEVEGYFHTVRQAKRYIEEAGLCEDECELYKLAEDKNYL